MAKNDNKLTYHQRQMRRNQIIFGVISVILILSMSLAAVANF
jgi:hypothetical protein